jgi:hypothetical protein
VLVSVIPEHFEVTEIHIIVEPKNAISGTGFSEFKNIRIILSNSICGDRQISVSYLLLRISFGQTHSRAQRPAYAATSISPPADVSHFVAWQSGQPAGRISAAINKQHNQHHGASIGFFGFFEVVKDNEIARTLFI